MLVAATAGDADARGKRGRNKAAAPSYAPAQASIVVDANSGKIIQQTNADSIRHPASLTKIMTLYMLFERLESGKLKLNSELPVSAHAAAQAPSKLGLKPGETIQVETAIRAIVTKSANDVAVIVGEALGGDEPSFGRMMTAKARTLGMMQTTYRNASGLPDDEQVTTARDQALLGRAIRDRFPTYFNYFSTRSFAFRGKMMRNHNRLLGVVDGVDGIKTGYIRASGFNIVTSVKRNNRYVVAVVFGGPTARARDARVRGLIESHISVASTVRTTPPIAEGTAMAETKLPAKPPTPVRDPREEAIATSSGGPSLGSTEPIKPVAVKTVSVKSGTRMAALSALPSDNRKLAPAPANTASVTTVATVKSSEPLPPPPGAAPGILGVLPAHEVKAPAPAIVASVSTEHASRAARGGWMIQVGAFPDETNAKERLTAAQTKAKEQLGKADPFTEKVAKGDRSLYRARFAGLDKSQAEDACKNLKRSEIPCMLLKN
ncbi:MAG: SPOR domain-containing protein [Pseudolabrys sp.]|nr:SPOR domain-containing protein [Pseudolabrys sp.]MDP2294389.1 SPOR domain-containing protein [Pseudolabrys sp.]